MVHMPTAEEIAALRRALSDAVERGEQAARRNEALTGELRMVRTERDLVGGAGFHGSKVFQGGEGDTRSPGCTVKHGPRGFRRPAHLLRGSRGTN